MTFNMYTGRRAVASVGEKFLSKANLRLSEHEVNPHFRQFVIQFHCARLAPRQFDFTFKQTGNRGPPADILDSRRATVDRCFDYRIRCAFLIERSSKKNNSRGGALKLSVKVVRIKRRGAEKRRRRREEEQKYDAHRETCAIIPNDSSNSPCR